MVSQFWQLFSIRSLSVDSAKKKHRSVIAFFIAYRGIGILFYVIKIGQFARENRHRKISVFVRCLCWVSKSRHNLDYRHHVITMPKSTGTNSQGNTWSTPGGTNSNNGSSFHCKCGIHRQSHSCCPLLQSLKFPFSLFRLQQQRLVLLCKWQRKHLLQQRQWKLHLHSS